jgi:hypothetical protein
VTGPILVVGGRHRKGSGIPAVPHLAQLQSSIYQWVLTGLPGSTLLALGVHGITTSCGLLSIYQRELAAHCRVPVAASALMQIPFVERLLPPRKRVGVLTFSAALLGPDHLIAAGAAPDTPVVGAENGREFWRVMARGEMTLDIAAARQDILAAGDELVAQHPEVGAVVLECTNMVPFRPRAPAAAAHAGLRHLQLRHVVSCWLESARFWPAR